MESLPNDPRSPSRTLTDCIILEICFLFFFDSFILADELFAKDLLRFIICLLVSNNLCQQLVPSLILPIIFDDLKLLKF